MKLGSALTKTATKAMLLGCGELGKEIAICLQRYGVEVIGVDRYADAPAQQIAHRSHVINMTDPEQLHQVIALENPHIIIPELEAIATEVLVDIEASNQACIVPSAKAIEMTMNREKIRTLAVETLGLPTSAYAFASNLAELQAAAETIGYPCFVKPTMSSSGKGQTLVKSPDQLEQAWNYAKVSGRADSGKVIIESKIDFDFEITLLTIRAADEQGVVQTYFCEPIGHLQEQGDYRQSWQPQSLTPAALESAKHIARQITQALGGIGVFGVELFIKNDLVWFCEVSPRPHDTGMVTMVTQSQNEFELHVRAILGLPICTKLSFPGASAVILASIASKDYAYSGIAEALKLPATEIRLFGKPEALPNRRMGVVLATAQDTKEARNRAVEAAHLVTIDTV